MPVSEIGGEKLNYWVGDKGIFKGRETILFIHGAGGNNFIWNYQKTYFQKEFNPIILELSGHGESEGNGRDDIASYSYDVFCFIKTINISDIILVGHSMGGAIVQDMALRYPDYIRGIVLVSTGAKLRVSTSILNGIKNNFKETIPKLVSFAYSKNAQKRLIQEGIENLRRCKPEILYKDFLACDKFDLLKEVENIKLPTSIICGSEDELTPVRYSQYLHQKIIGSQLEIISGAGHMVMMESPEIFNERLRKFIMALRHF